MIMALLSRPRYRARWEAFVALDAALRECCRSRKPLEVVLTSVSGSAPAEATCGGLAVARGAFASAIAVNYPVQSTAPWTPDVHHLACSVFAAVDLAVHSLGDSDARPHIDARDVLTAMAFLAKFKEDPTVRLAAGFAAFAGPIDASGEPWLAPEDVARVLLATCTSEEDAVAVMFAAAGVSLKVPEARRKSVALVVMEQDVAPASPSLLQQHGGGALPPPTILNMISRGAVAPAAGAPTRITLRAFTAFLGARPALVEKLHEQFKALLSTAQRGVLVGARADAAEAAMAAGLRAVEARCIALATAEAAAARAAAEEAARIRFAEVRVSPCGLCVFVEHRRSHAAAAAAAAAAMIIACVRAAWRRRRCGLLRPPPPPRAT